MDGLKRATQNGERIYEYRMYQLFSIHEDCKYIYNDFIFLDKVTRKTLGIRTWEGDACVHRDKSRNLAAQTEIEI